MICPKCDHVMAQNYKDKSAYRCPCCNLQLLHIEAPVVFEEPTAEELDERFYEAQGAID